MKSSSNSHASPHFQHICLPGDGTDLAEWRRRARALVMAGVAPDAVSWRCEYQARSAPDLFAAVMETGPMALALNEGAHLEPSAHGAASSLTVPRKWMAMAEQCLLHASPERFGLLYRLLWRMQRESGLKHDPLDADQVRMQHMVKAVRREVHKMHAFVRFRPMEMEDDPADGTGPLHVAWFEPEHFITHAAAPFFVKRFANMRWAILTPHTTVRWWPAARSVADLAEHGVLPECSIQPLKGRPGVLSWGAGANASDAPPPDAGEGLWLTYYAHIFNPARVKTAAMRKEMPRRYWRNLPEAQLISPLVQAAQARSAAMLAQAPTQTRRRLPGST